MTLRIRTVAAASLFFAHSLALRILSVGNAENEVYDANLELSAEVTVQDVQLEAQRLDLVNPQFCWEVKSRFFDETIGGCWSLSSEANWNGTQVLLANRG